MPAATRTPNAVAHDLSRTLKRTITAKAVRTVARDVLARFNKDAHPEYQSHAYSAGEVATLRKTFEGRGQRSKAQPQRKASKPSVKRTRKATPVVESVE